ncbi:M42 family metallopeptidase [Streptomyces fuscichromogenes]|uniref:Peptidase M42 n=1 Tax=Streptomyces fuscichromogenes TaxID=1324013 RepID=A0A917UKH5_9ACTN|nr:M20/M25/M40 family metallo-hydrolase [Streptomyces fuscichromogenes]GGM97168.1 peptidase M42 [Streptomyces fuscichromogenes]
MFELIKQLTELPGPCGHEGAVADFLRQRWAGSGAEVSTTSVGNVVGRIPGDGPRLMVQAHMDEMSLRVRTITEDGFVHLGAGMRGSGFGILPEAVNRIAQILTPSGLVDGVFARATGHLRGSTGGRLDGGIASWDDVFVDLGLPDRRSVLAAGIHVGSPVLYRAKTRRLGRHLIGKALDDRVGLALMTALADRLAGTRATRDVVLVATVQEETGAVGAASLRHDLGSFHEAVALEVGPAGDFPGMPSDAREVALGRGPALVHSDAATHYDAGLTRVLLDLADRNKIPVQHAAFASFGTDGAQLMMQGIPTALLTVPTRYTHSPFEMVHLDDVSAALDLLVAACNR